MEEHCRDADHQAGCRSDKGLGDTTGQHRRIGGHLRPHEGAEDIDHAQHGTQQAEQRGHRGDGTEGADVALQFMNDPRGRLLDALFHDFTAMARVGQARSEDFTQRRIGAQGLELVTGELLVLDPHPHLAQQVRRGNAAGAQGPQALDDDSHGSDGAQNDRQHHPTTGLDQFPHSKRPFGKRPPLYHRRAGGSSAGGQGIGRDWVGMP
ncbi:hypothetical protein D3C78_1320170 [compost metagenome]